MIRIRLTAFSSAIFFHSFPAMASPGPAKLLSARKRPINPNPNPIPPSPSLSIPLKKIKKQSTDHDGSTSFSSLPSSSSSSSSISSATNPNRVRLLKKSSIESAGTGAPVLYWMSRDQRSIDNWALLYAFETAKKKGASLGVVFNLVESFLGARARHFAFMLRGLRIVEKKLAALNIPFFLVRGEAKDNIPTLLEKCSASTLVVDFSPLRICREWRKSVCQRVPPCVDVYEVDAHNVVPLWVSSDKLEYSARTIRTKIQKHLSEYLVEYPQLEALNETWSASEKPDIIDWDSLIDEVTRKGGEVPEVKWCKPGEDEAMDVLLGKKNGFLTTRIKNYADDRNDPSKPSGLSGLSPYLHYGHISAQRCAFEARKLRSSHTKAIDSFLEELIIRRELADNFCFYQPHYDNLQGAYQWARDTLLEHASDKREHIYTRDQLEKAKTHDELWNASQLEMVHLGKMHGFMRMYWAKKILEWTTGPEEALAIAIYLNDKYELDGRDPNGYVGCMWSICGIHDQGWKERPVFGKIRYMNYNGCKRKFNVDGYIMYVKRAVAELRKAAKVSNNISS